MLLYLSPVQSERLNSTSTVDVVEWDIFRSVQSYKDTNAGEVKDGCVFGKH